MQVTATLKTAILASALVASTVASIRLASADESYDLVIANGRVMDPDSGLDAVRNVGISSGKIRAISAGALKGASTIDAKGLVVAPGFIDLHEHGQEPRNYQFQAHDGVLEGGTDDVDKWYANREGKSLINYGVSIGHIPVRANVMANVSGPLLGGNSADVQAAFHRPATPEELAKMKQLIEIGMKQGA